MKFYIYSLGTYSFFATILLILLMVQNHDLKQIFKSMTEPADFDSSKIYQVDTSDALSFGPDHAPLNLVVFSDFDCPGCQNFDRFLDELIVEKSPDIALRYKFLPLDPTNLVRTKAAYSAGMQGQFWDFKTFLFLDQNPLDLEDLLSKVTEFGLDPILFEKDFLSVDVEKVINETLHQAEDLEIQFLPTVFINGSKLEGATEDRFLAVLAGLKEAE